MGTGMGKPKPSARGFSAAKQQVNKSSADHAAKEQLAGALINQSRFEEAEAIYRSLIAAGTTNHIVYINLAAICGMKGRFEQIVELLRKALEIKPNLPEAHNNLGNVFTKQGDLDSAIASYNKALQLKPNYPEAHYNLGNIHQKQGDLDAAVASYSTALKLKPDYPQARYKLGNVLQKQGDLDAAIACFNTVLQLKPDHLEAQNNLGNILQKRGNLDAAIACFNTVLQLKPNHPEAHYNLGNALQEQGGLEAAIACFNTALQLQPNYPEAHLNLGYVLQKQGSLDAAIARFNTALQLQPNYPEAYNNLGNALSSKGQLSEAIAAYRQAIALAPDKPCMHGNYLFNLNYDPKIDMGAVAEEHRLWNQAHGDPLRQFIQSHTNDRNPERRLRVGYVSPDFRNHSVAHFLEALLEHHNTAEVEVFCYSNVAYPDATTDRFEKLSTHWRRIIGLSDSQAAELIRADKIDILVDLAGHTASNSLPVFARKPAPVQVTWLGYANTTGLDAIDYRITDAFADPPGTTEHLHSEQLIRLPRSAWCYYPLENAPAVGTPPVRGTGHITFGCFNAMPKINQPLIKLWARILHNLPGSRLLLKNNSLGEESVQQQLTQQFKQEGISPELLLLTGSVPDQSGHLASYGRVDIALDTFPYHGTTTSCEALWMGVPMVVLAGKTHISRVGVSLLSNLGHPEWIATNPEEYIQIALDLAKDITHLAALRVSLRETMRNSPLMDAAGFALDMESAFRKMWRTWCAQPESLPCP